MLPKVGGMLLESLDPQETRLVWRLSRVCYRDWRSCESEIELTILIAREVEISQVGKAAIGWWSGARELASSNTEILEGRK